LAFDTPNILTETSVEPEDTSTSEFVTESPSEVVFIIVAASPVPLVLKVVLSFLYGRE